MSLVRGTDRFNLTTQHPPNSLHAVTTTLPNPVFDDQVWYGGSWTILKGTLRACVSGMEKR